MLSRDEALDTERRAWVEAERDGGRVDLCDGIKFWCRQVRGDCPCERCAS